MSAIFYVYRNGKKSKGYKYEDLHSIWFTETNGSKPTPQITITLNSNKDVTYNSWDHGMDDHRLTQESLEQAVSIYNKSLIEIESRRKTLKHRIEDLTPDKPDKKVKK